MIAQHSSATNEHYTPRFVVDAARATLGGIDLDPASCKEANLTVQADEFFSESENGLEKHWAGRVFLNPPGGKAPPNSFGTRSNAALWWAHLATRYESGAVKAGVFVGFTLEILRAAQGLTGRVLQPIHFPLCIPAKRLKFKGDSPTHANVIVYLGPSPERFKEAFAEIGAVRI